MAELRVDIIPGRAIGPIELGMSPEQVAVTLLSFGCRDFDDISRPLFDRAFSGSIQIDYDVDSQTCQCISIYWHPDCGCECYFLDRHVKEYSAEELFSLLSKLDGGDHTFQHQSDYEFPSLGMALNDLSTIHDYQNNGTRLVYGEIIVEQFA